MKLDRIHRGVRACVLLMFAYSALGLGVLALFGGKLSLLFLDSAESAAVRDQIGSAGSSSFWCGTPAAISC